MTCAINLVFPKTISQPKLSLNSALVSRELGRQECTVPCLAVSTILDVTIFGMCVAHAHGLCGYVLIPVRAEALFLFTLLLPDKVSQGKRWLAIESTC